MVPRLHYWEMANVLRTSVLRGRLTESLARDIWALHLEAPLEVVEPATADVLAIHQNHDYGHIAGGQRAAWYGVEVQRS